jgi:NTE family protein
MKSRAVMCNVRRFLLVCLLMPAVLPAAEVRTLMIGDTWVSISSYGLNQAQMQQRPKVALVLSGGGARGFAHIPIIESIERAGIPVDMVLGTSMGSLVGGLYAAGYSPGDMRRLIASHDMVRMFALPAVPPQPPEPMPLRRSRDNLLAVGFDSSGLGTSPGIIGDQRILQMLNDALSRVAGINDFDRLAIPFRCIGTDVVTGERVVFSSGSLVAAIRASISIPVVFTPYPVGDRLMVDGGLVDNMPVSLAREMGADIVIAVDVNAVDYDVEASDLESITAILSQLVVILTKNTVAGQSGDSDLLITPGLTGHGILDFNEVDEILKVGEEAGAMHAEDIGSLAAKIAEERPLRVLDPDRYGPYFSLPDVFIRSVSHRSLQGEQAEFDLSLFSEHVGVPLDQKRKERLGRLFEDLRRAGSYASVSYDYTDVILGTSNSVWGNLEIQTRSFTPKRSTIAAGIYGAMSLHLGAPGDPRFEFKPDFSLRHTYTGNPSWIVSVTNDDALRFSGQLSTAVGDDWSAGVELAYVTGGIHPTNLRSAFSGAPFRDRMIQSELSLHYMPTERVVAKLGADLDHIWYGNPVDAREGLVPALRFEGVWATMPFGFFPRKGIRFDLMAVAEFHQVVGYRLEGRFQSALSLGRRDVVLLDLHGGTSHVAVPRKESYFDYGGSRGMPTCQSTFLVDDMLLLRLKHFHWIDEEPVGVVLQSMLAAGFRGDSVGDILASDRYAENPGFPFSSLGDFDVSASIAIGLSFDTLDVLLGCAVDDRMRVSVFLEVL